jgi:hypothetical protein
MTSGAPSTPKPDDVVYDALDKIKNQVYQAEKKGEVLFIDQRQLLTFGYIEDIPLIPEYEKKYLMDQAMAGNRPYFEKFYEDLRNHRFSLIVSEPLNTNYQDQDEGFSEENNAWVKWVSEPLLCYYEPMKKYREVKIQLFVPRTETLECAIPAE